MSHSTLKERLVLQRERIAGAAVSCGRDPREIKIIAASKRQSASAIREAYALGQRDFGENYVQELVQKAEELKDLKELRWHMIGHLQSNKSKGVAGLVSMVHTVSSLKLVEHLGRRIAQASSSVHPLPVLVEVNVSGELTKSGCTPAALPGILEALHASEALQAVGLMTMPPALEDPDEALPYFERLAALRDQGDGALSLPELSMGMSADVEVAVRAGATLVRLGSAIFGPRTDNRFEKTA